MTLLQVRTLALYVPALALVGLLGCKSSVSAVSAASNVDVSPDPPTYNEQFAARNPRVCAQLMTPPTPAQAAVLVQCDHESASQTSGMYPALTLVTDVQVQMSAPRDFQGGMGTSAPDVDVKGQVYDLRGQGTTWTCQKVGFRMAAGSNCIRSSAVPKGKGQCYRTTFGDWKCQMTVGSEEWTPGFKGPTAF